MIRRDTTAIYSGCHISGLRVTLELFSCVCCLLPCFRGRCIECNNIQRMIRLDLVSTANVTAAVLAVATVAVCLRFCFTRVRYSSPCFGYPESDGTTFRVIRLDAAAVASVIAAECHGESYPELGCFDNTYPVWFNARRPCSAPQAPEKVGTKIIFYSRTDPAGVDVPLWPKIDLTKTHYDSRKCTVFIVHGFATNSTDSPWISSLTKAYLEKRDVNVFVVDWGMGAKQLAYCQVASNSRICGAELGRFALHLVTQWGQSPDCLHLIGHSAGAHAVGYAAKRLKDKGYLAGKCTTFDAAQPCYQGQHKDVRVDKDDCKCLEALYSNAQPTVPCLGFGTTEEYAHINYWMNGGAKQPGCSDPEKPENFTLSALYTSSVETVVKFVSCSHGRACEYYANYLNLTDCRFVGTPVTNTMESSRIQMASMGVATGFKQGVCLVSRVSTNMSASECSKDTNCTYIGWNKLGSFNVETTGQPPYCKSKASDVSWADGIMLENNCKFSCCEG